MSTNDWIELVKTGAPGPVLSLQTKLTKHVRTGNVESLRRYVNVMVNAFPVRARCPIDPDLVSEVGAVLRKEGYVAFRKEGVGVRFHKDPGADKTYRGWQRLRS